MHKGKALRGHGDTQPKLWEEIIGLLEYPHIDYSWIPFLRLWGTSFLETWISIPVCHQRFSSPDPSLLCPRQNYHNRPGDAFSGQRGHPPSVDSCNFRSWESRGYSTVSMTWELVKRLKKYTVLLGTVNCVKYSCNLEVCGEKGIPMEESELNQLEPSKDH